MSAEMWRLKNAIASFIFCCGLVSILDGAQQKQLEVEVTLSQADAAAPAALGRSHRYKMLEGLLNSSEKWAAGVQDQRLVAQLRHAESKLAVLMSTRAHEQELTAAQNWAARDRADEASAASALHSFDEATTTREATRQRESLARAEKSRDSLTLSNRITETEQEAALAKLSTTAPAPAPTWATSAEGALKQVKNTLKREQHARDADRAQAKTARIEDEIKALHRGQKQREEEEPVQQAAALHREERVLSAPLSSPESRPKDTEKNVRERTMHTQKSHALAPRPNYVVVRTVPERRDTVGHHLATKSAPAHHQLSAALDVEAPSEPTASVVTPQSKSPHALADFIVDPKPSDMLVSRAHTAPVPVNIMEERDSLLRQARASKASAAPTRSQGMSGSGTMRKQGLAYPIATVGGIPQQQVSTEQTECPQPMPTMLHHEMRAMLCWTLQLEESACALVWGTVPALYSDTVGLALRHRVSSSAQMQRLPTKIVFDVEEVREGTTQGVNMGSMAAGFTYQGVSSAWEHHGVEIAQSSPLGMEWTMRFLGFSGEDMKVKVMDCNSQILAGLKVDVNRLKGMPKPDQAAVKVATVSTITGTELAVMRSALGGSKLGSLFELVDTNGQSVGIMIEEGMAGAWLIQMERRPDVDIRAVSMLAATLSIAREEQGSGFLVGLTVPLVFLLAALSSAFCIRVKLGSNKHTAAHAYQTLDSDRDTYTYLQPPARPTVTNSRHYQDLQTRRGMIETYQPSHMYQAPRSHMECHQSDHILHAPQTLQVHTEDTELAAARELLAADAQPQMLLADPVSGALGSLREKAGVDDARSISSFVSEIAAGPLPTVEQYQKVPLTLTFPHATRPPVVSGATAAAFRGVDEALAAVEAALSSHPYPGAEIADHALVGVVRALDVGDQERRYAEAMEPITATPSISSQRRADSQRRFQDALLDHVGL